MEATVKNKSIRVISLRMGFYYPTWFKQLPTLLPNLKKIIILADFQPTYSSEFTRTVEADPKLNSLIEYK